MESNSTSISALAPVWCLALATVIELVVVPANVITIRIIIKNKKLHSPCFILIGGAACGSLLVALANLIVNIMGMGDQLGFWSQSDRTRGFCYLSNLYALGSIAYPFNGISVVLVAIDRLFGALAPLKYRLLGKKYAIKALALAALFALVIGAVIIAGVDSLSTILPTCNFVLLGMGEWSFHIFNTVNSTLNILCVLSYLAMFISGYVGKWRMKRKANGGFATSAELQSYLRQQAAITPAAKMLSILHVITGIVPNLIFGLVIPGGILYNIAVQFIVSGSLVEFVSLTLRCEDFRLEVHKLINCYNNQVTVISGQNHGNGMRRS